MVVAKPDVYHIDTTNVLFILSGAFVGLDAVIKQRVAKGVSDGLLVCLWTLIFLEVHRFYSHSAYPRAW